jgi:hypothetical protein
MTPAATFPVTATTLDASPPERSPVREPLQDRSLSGASEEVKVEREESRVPFLPSGFLRLGWVAAE